MQEHECTVHESIAGSFRVITEKKKDGTKIPTGFAVVWKDGKAAHYASGEFLDLLGEAFARTVTEGAAIFSRRSLTVLAAYDLPYDISSVWPDICDAYEVTPLAKSPGDIYQLRLRDRGTSGNNQLVLWDLRHMQPGGIRAMAESIGMEQDGTAEGDCRVMMGYIRATADRHEIREGLGSRVMTLTGTARHDAAEAVGKLEYDTSRGATRTLSQDYFQRALVETPRTYPQYALRRSCNRGGLVFTAARHAGKVMGRTIAIDESSAHHAQACCRMVPERFHDMPAETIRQAAEGIARKDAASVLRCYFMPFKFYFHAAFKFTHVTLRPGSVWEHEEIGTTSMARFADSSGVEGVDDEASVEAERAIRAAGYGDKVVGGVYAFGKLMAAEEVTTHMTELEFWVFSQVYSWESMEVLYGEGTCRRRRPEDYAILTSMHFYRGKQRAKEARNAAAGAERERLASIYDNQVKPAFNAVGYGLHARDELKPSYEIRDGQWVLQAPVSEETWEERRPKRPKAWYSYGIRISNGSRMHLVLAVELLWQAFGDRVAIVAGDTDSLKIASDDITEAEVLAALEPLHAATRAAIERTASRAARLFPDAYGTMTGVGEFEVEDVHEHFYSPGPKQYVSIDADGSVALTLAGVPRSGDDSYAAWLKCMVDAFGPACLPQFFTFGVRLHPNVSQLKVLDYADAYAHGQLPDVQGVYYTLNDPRSPEHACSILWQRRHGREIDIDPQALAAWDASGAVFWYAYGELHS